MCRENALGPTENISTHCELHNTLAGFEVFGSLFKYEFATFYFDKKLVKLQCPLVCEFFREITKFIYYTSSFNISFFYFMNLAMNLYTC